MRTKRTGMWMVILVAVAMCAAPLGSARAGGVTVGSSSLIGTLDYSDTFTIGPASPIVARQTYPVQTFPLPAGVDVVEDNHGNPARSWGTSNWSIATDAANSPGGVGYPGGSGAGSATGMTQTGAGASDWGIQYGLRNDFVVQTDFVQTSDRIDITIGGVIGNVFDSTNLSVFFRHTNHPSYPEIGLFNVGVGEQDAGLSSGIARAGEWHNYAARFMIDTRQIEVFVDEGSLGVIDLDTVAGGVFAPLALSNATVGVGYSGGDRGWSDNFQVGGPLDIPEPVTLAMLGLAAGALGGYVRRRRKA